MSTVLDSHAWEEYCLSLLAVRYKDGLQRIPAARRGDLGIEAFCTDGVAFQCYCPLEPMTVDERYSKHRDKLTKDLGKLASNAEELSSLLGPVVLSKWVLMLPQWDDPRVLLHAQKKSVELRAQGLAILSDDFLVLVHTADDYPAERALLVEAGLNELGLDVEEPLAAEQEQWAAANVTLVNTLDEKLARLPLNEDQRAVVRAQILSSYLMGQNYLGRLYADYPRQWEAVDSVIRGRELYLAGETTLATTPGSTVIQNVIDEVQRELLGRVSSLGAGARTVAWGAASDWLLRCPLEILP